MLSFLKIVERSDRTSIINFPFSNEFLEFIDYLDKLYEESFLIISLLKLLNLNYFKLEFSFFDLPKLGYSNSNSTNSLFSLSLLSSSILL